MDKNAEKDRLRKEIAYYTDRIENFHKDTKSKLYLESSDSEDDIPTFHTPGPLISELRTTESGLQTSLQATQELTSLTVLQYETNVMVEPPKIKRGKPITESGTWREVAAECRIDAIPFSITFCTHQATKKFAPILYRNLSVLPVKKVHEVELEQSVLPDVTRPSDVIEVLKSYASAFRSRRTSLACLANKYTNIELEPAPEGGYLLKCGSVLAITWRLENKWTPLTPFHHKMKFDLDYMEEDQLKIIKQAHKKISDPTINTDERTLLLAKIISTCLEIKATQDESMESEVESIKRTDRTIIEDNPDEHLIIQNENQSNLNKNGENINLERDSNVNAQRVKEKEIMAPPKSLPKKAKAKGKENKVDNRKSVKRTADEVSVESSKDRNSIQSKNKSDDNQVKNDKIISKNTKNDNNVTKNKNDEVKNDKRAKISVHNEMSKNDRNSIQSKNNSDDNQVKNDKIISKNTKNDNNVTKNKNYEVRNDKSRPKSAGNSKENANKQLKSKLSIQSEGSQPKKAKIDENQAIERNIKKNSAQKTNIVDKFNKTNENKQKSDVIKDKVVKNTQTKKPVELNKQKNMHNSKEPTKNTEADKNKEIPSKNIAKSTANAKNQVKTLVVSQKPTKTTTNVEKTTTGTVKTTEPTTVTEKTTKSNPNVAKTNENQPKTNSKNIKFVKNPIAGPSTSKSTENLKKNINKQINIVSKKTDQNKVTTIPKNTLPSKNIQKISPNNTKKQNSNVVAAKNVNKTKITIKSHSNPSKIKTTGNIINKNPKGISKIPQKKYIATSTPQNFMWVSPRNRPSTTSDTNLLSTNIPRLLKKPSSKIN